jgi:hypothetical protein
MDLNRIDAADTPTCIAINEALEAGARVDIERTRGYLGASQVGHPCMRKIQFDWMCNPVHATQTRDIFARGHFFEAQTKAHFEKAGFKFADQSALEFEDPSGWLRGHADGIFLSGPAIPELIYPALWEHKAINAKGYASLKRDGLAKAYPQYAAQVALYQRWLLFQGWEREEREDVNPAIFTATCADTCERLHILVPYDAELALETHQRAMEIVRVTRAGELLPRMTENPTNWRCKKCGHRERCWSQP